MGEIVNFLVGSVGQMGYLGIVFLMFLESSFFPFPSEVVMIPGGYLAYSGEMDFKLVILFGIIGSLLGSWLNYFLADRFGRVLLLKIISEEKIRKLEIFFEKHGHISVFIGRLIPGVRQYISFPAGLAKMDKVKFTLYTGIGAGIWCLILTLLGYFLKENQGLIVKSLKEITIITFLLSSIAVSIYIKINRINKKNISSMSKN